MNIVFALRTRRDEPFYITTLHPTIDQSVWSIMLFAKQREGMVDGSKSLWVQTVSMMELY